MTQTSHPLTLRLRALAAELASLDAGLGARVAPLVAELDAPLRLAVVGRVKAGKSTLVNALVGRRVAPTAAGECTRVVTWYRHGSPDRAEAVDHQGRRTNLPLVDGRLPADLPVDPTQLARIEVTLQSAALRTKTLIDTPGLASATAASSASRQAAADADALLYLFRDSERVDELDFLRDFADACGPFASAGVNAAGVLAHADLVGDGNQDPFPLAAGLAARLSADHSRTLADVVPVAGLLAETARTGHLTDADVRLLATLRDADPTHLRLAVAGHLPLAGVDPTRLADLVGRLGAYATVAAPTGDGAHGLLAWLDDRSGVAELERVVATELEGRAALLKGARALAALQRAVRGHAEAEARVEAAWLDPVTHGVRELVAVQRLRAEEPDSPALDELVASMRTPTWAADGTEADWGERAAAAQAEATTALAPVEAEAWRVLARSHQFRLAAALADRTRINHDNHHVKQGER